MQLNTHHKSFFQFFNYVFLSLSAAILAVILLCGIIFHRLYSSVEQVVQVTVPSINRIADVGNNARTLSTLIPRIKQINNQADLNLIATQIDLASQEMALEIPQLIASKKVLSNLHQLIIGLEDNIAIHFQLADSSITEETLLESSSSSLLDDLSDTSKAMRVLYVKAEAELFSLSGKEDITALIATTQFISNISHDLELLTIMVLNAKRELDPIEIEKTQEEFNTVFRNIVFTLSNLSHLELTAFNNSINKIYHQALADGNYFECAKRTKKLKQQLSESEISITQSLNAITDILGPLLENNTRVDQATLSELLVSSDNYFLLISLLTVVTLIIVAVLNYRIVPRSIISPLKQMASDIIGLSKNELTTIEFTHDSKELAKVREALLIFQQNAEALMISNAELKRFNDNLKTFLRVSSHDLKTPLRGISLLVQLIREDLESNDTSAVVDNLEKIDLRTVRMQNLLTSLTEYMRITKPEENLVQINFDELVQEQFTLLNISNNFELSIERDISLVTINAVPFKTVIRNLIDNALKHHDKDTGLIKVILNSQDTHLYIQLIDDGAGIPERFHERIFEPFETLQPKDEVEGSGMGLAIIQKIIRSHGGTIAVNSPVQDGRGSRFSFTWQKS